MLPLPSANSDSVVVDECFIHQGMLHAIASNGGGMISGKHGFALRFIKSENNPMLKVQLVCLGMGKKVETQSYVRPKIVIQKEIVFKKELESKVVVGNTEEI